MVAAATVGIAILDRTSRRITDADNGFGRGIVLPPFLVCQVYGMNEKSATNQTCYSSVITGQ